MPEFLSHIAPTFTFSGSRKSPSIKCRSCGKDFSRDRRAGTANRNHCPYCLVSLHVDENTGDRRSKCRGKMQAIGLVFKHVKRQKYPSSLHGELMLVHRCDLCGKLSLNRLAADDDADKILAIFKRQQKSIDQSFLGKLAAENINLAQEEDEKEVRSQLLGNQ